MSVHGYTDDEFIVYDPVTLISRLDVSNPLHLYPNDSAALTVMSVKLKGTENYQWDKVNVAFFKDSVTKKIDITSNDFQDLNHINYFDIEYPEITNDDERVDRSLNSDQRSQSDSSHFSMHVGHVNTTDFLNDNSGNDAQSSDNIFAAQDEQLNKNSEPNFFYEASKFTHRTDATNDKMDCLT
ncbi:hypothetical protein Tco_0942981 [Tanacetum coccineum]